MLELIKNCLKESGAYGWEITDEKTEGWEFYFIGHRLDQNRVRSVEHINVKVYQKFEDFLGSASAEIPVTASLEEVRKQIGLLLEEALLVKNPFYELNTPKEFFAEEQKQPDLAGIARDFIEVLKDPGETEDVFLNSYEIFVNGVTKRFVNSNGIDVTSVYPSSMAEVVINARNGAHEIELYRMFTSGTCDRETVKKELQNLMQYGKDRLNAGKTPNLGRYDVVFSTAAAAELYEYFFSRMSANMKYQKLSDWEIGKSIAEFQGDRITLKALRHLDNSSLNCEFDSEGAPVRDLTLIEAGVPAAWYGSRQFSWYLGLQDSFLPQNYSAEGGSSTAEELRTGNFLEVVEFSDFLVDSVSGNIAGEIRLGYLHTEKGTEIVSGGSVSGTMADLIPGMRCSIEQKQYNNRRIPSVTRLHGVTVSGAQ